jgi:GR25 family glycosyltransferase involved in LPS biosynthesis
MTDRPRIFVINLQRSPDRRRFIADRLDQLGLDREFFSAVDGATLSKADLENYDRKARLKAFGCDLQKRGNNL